MVSGTSWALSASVGARVTQVCGGGLPWLIGSDMTPSSADRCRGVYRRPSVADDTTGGQQRANHVGATRSSSLASIRVLDADLVRRDTLGLRQAQRQNAIL